MNEPALSEPELDDTESTATRFTAPPAPKTRRQKVFAVLPTLLTLSNAVCGFGAITLCARVGPDMLAAASDAAAVAGGVDAASIPLITLFHASQLIFLAMLFDMLDGSAARLTNQTSEFGAQLDSLCDAVSFGVAPAFIMLKLTHPDNNLLHSLTQPPFEYPARILWAIAALFMLCAILRLARFNVETDDEDSHSHFSGLPSPAAAGVIAAFPIGLKGLHDLTIEGNVKWARPVTDFLLPALSLLLPLIALTVAILMVSRVRYAHVFNQLVRGERGRRQLLKMVFALVLVFVVREMALPLIFCYFALAAPLQAFVQKQMQRWRNRTASR
ncbi:MAG: CDP-alcohol phosphatidyltransferase family protein [Planctomycetaceae bacterium]|nr:CDP-alcohol phosphatidyltransferase family protein [Planctomycetaceae bacterium]